MKGRTQWYPFEVKPVRVGWYERYYAPIGLSAEEIYLDWWSGTCWFMAYDELHKRGACPSTVERKWRGQNYPSLSQGSLK